MNRIRGGAIRSDIFSRDRRIYPGVETREKGTSILVAAFLAGVLFLLIPPVSAQGFMIVGQWGESGDVPVPGDYDGDGKSDYAVWRPSTRVWYIKQSSNGVVIATSWGDSTDIPVPADYDGDGKTDIAVWRPTGGLWYCLSSSDLKLTGWGEIRLADLSNGSKAYSFAIQVQNPDGTTLLTEKNRIQDVNVYSYPSLVEVPQSTPWSLWFSPAMYFDANGTDPTPPNPLPWSETDGFLDLSLGTLSVGFYTGVVTDASGRQHEVWLYYEHPTEVSKVQSSSMGVTDNGDGTVTLSWTNPTLDPAKNIIRVYVNSTVDSSGDGFDDGLLLASLPSTSNSYTIPAAEVTRLKAYSGLYWFVQIRETKNNVVNPDATTKNYVFYRNYGQTQTLSLP